MGRGVAERGFLHWRWPAFEPPVKRHQTARDVRTDGLRRAVGGARAVVCVEVEVVGAEEGVVLDPLDQVAPLTLEDRHDREVVHGR